MTRTASDLLERAADLRRAGRPFVLATVVRSVRPASAKPGDRALLFADGASEGWVGGGCVQTSVEREAARALADGVPRLVKLSPEPDQEEGVVGYPMVCHSGGTLEVYLEPVLPPPQLVVLGESVVADALAELAGPLGFRVRSELADAAPGDAWVVVAGMSSGDDEPLVRAALATEVPYVALVASRRRAQTLLDGLRADGVPDAALARIKAPAGLDIGAVTGAEIALSILSEIVQLRRARVAHAHAVTAAAASAVSAWSASSDPASAHAGVHGHTADATTPSDSSLVAIDPICGMEVEVATARWSAERDGQVFYFCAPGCRRAFLAQTATSAR